MYIYTQQQFAMLLFELCIYPNAHTAFLTIFSCKSSDKLYTVYTGQSKAQYFLQTYLVCLCVCVCELISCTY